MSLFGDETLARLTGKGSEQAFAGLYERYHQTLFRYCRSILRDDADAQDALQSTFTAALAALQRGQRKAPVRPWLFRIAHNEAISLLRRRRPAGTDLSDAPTQLASSAEDRAAARARFTQLIADLNELPERARAALLMRELSGLSHEEIAIALETSAGAAKQAIFDARRALSELAEGRGMSCEEIRRQISDGDGRALRSRRLRAHLRDCTMCSAFAAAIPARRSDLRALAPPLPAAASAALLSRTLSSTSAHGVHSGAAGSMTTGALVKAAGTTIASKVVVGVAVVVGAAASVGGVTVALVHAGARPAEHASQALSNRSNTEAGLVSPAPSSPQTRAPTPSRIGEHNLRAGQSSSAKRPRASNQHQQASAGASRSSHGHGRTGKAGPSQAAGVGRGGSGGHVHQKAFGYSPAGGGQRASGKSARPEAPTPEHRAKGGTVSITRAVAKGHKAGQLGVRLVRRSRAGARGIRPRSSGSHSSH